MNHIFNQYKKIAEKIIPELSENNFIKTGLLTKSQFIKAGDYLIQNNPEWSWITSGKKKTNVLIYKNIIYNNCNNYTQDTQDGNDWNVYSNQKIDTQQNDSNNDELMKLEEELESSDDEKVPTINNLKKKIYDITITYDTYYRTPRIWFHCYNYYNQPLTNQSILNDFSIEHTGVSIKIETHPHYDIECVSVHPCKHSEVMKKLIKIELENNKNIVVKHYFIYFLKFVSCIFPNMNFDFTTII